MEIGTPRSLLGSMALFIFAMPVPAMQDEVPIETFIRLQHDHGVPYGQAHDYGASVLAKLEYLLLQEEEKQHWSTIVATIGFIGDHRGHEILNRFVWTRFNDEVDLPTFQALIVAQGILGHIVAYGDSDLLLDLEKGVDPAYWNDLPWHHRHYRGEALSVLWSKLTINALAYTSKARAEQVLERLKRRPFSPRQIPNIEEGLQRYKEVVAVGLDAYERERDRMRSEG